jgi:hypothetical protein
MKNTLLKVWGIVLTVAILAGLLMIAAPVSAGNLSWTTVGMPTVTVGTSANVYAFAPNGKTMFLYDGAKLNQSNDSGLTWSSNSIGTGLTATTKSIVVDPTNAANMVATDGTHVYRSQTSGVSFSTFDPPTLPGGYVATSVDTTSDAWGSVVVAGYDNGALGGGVALYDNGTWFTTWGGTLGTTAIWNNGGTAIGAASASAFAVKLSPSYVNDSALVVVAGSAQGFALRTIITNITTPASTNWNKDVADAQLTAIVGVAAPTANSLASIDTGSDYYWASSTSNHVFVGLGDKSAVIPLTTPLSVYRVDGTLFGSSAPSVYNLAGSGSSAWDVSSLDYNGTASTGVLAVGFYNSNLVRTATDAVSNLSTSGATWTVSVKSPTGSAITNTLVRFAPGTTTLYAGTANINLAAATATATATLGFPVTTAFGAALSGGTFYTTNPTVSIAPPGTPNGVTATANPIVVGGTVTGITLTNAGAGYTAPPAITFVGGVVGLGGTFAGANTLVLGTTGGVFGFTITNTGYGYADKPTVTVSAAPAGGTTAVITANITTGAVSSFSVASLTAAGAGYTTAPTLTLQTPPVGAALAMSTNYTSFNEIAFIAVSSLSNITMASGGRTGTGAVTTYQKMTDNGGGSGSNGNANVVLFQSTDSSATWKEIFSCPGTFSYSLSLSPSFATDNTMYLYATTGTLNNRIYKSIDGGATWNINSIYGNTAISAFAPIDGTNYWFGNATIGVRSTLATSAAFSLNGVAPSILGVYSPTFFSVSTSDGDIWVSVDGGNTFASLGVPAVSGANAFTTLVSATDVPNKTIYILDQSNNIWSYTVGTSTAWTQFLSGTILVGTTGITGITGTTMGPTGSVAINSMTKATGAWYFRSNINPAGEIWRSTTLVAGSFEPVIGSAYTAMPSNFAGGNSSLTIVNAAGNNTIYYNVNYNGALVTPNSYNYKWVTFTDSVLAAPATIAPVASANTPATVDFSWKAVTNATAYDSQIAYDSAFNNIFTSRTANASTIWPQVVLTPGQTYYWRVRVSVASPMASAWSAGVMFTTQLGSVSTSGIDVGRYPAPGATGIAGNAFSWGTVAGASTYEFKISTKADFSDIVDSSVGLTGTVYQTLAKLSPGTTYFWEVRAVSGTVTGPWVTATFTTATAAQANPTATTAPVVTVPQPTFIIPTQPAPVVNVTVPTPTNGNTSNSTPAWAWVVIAIAAVLVIAVIVLIARTRRV